MLHTSLRRATCTLPSSSRLLHATALKAAQAPPGKDPRLSQGTASKPGEHQHPNDVHDQAARSGQKVAQGSQSLGPYDAASRTGDQKTDRSGLSGNQEGVGFAEQVGSASGTGSKSQPSPSAGEGMGGQEESTPPGLFASIKSKIGLNTSSDEVKQNRGGGVGVTGTGALPFEKKPSEGRRPFHTSASRAADPTTGQAPEASRQPKERTHAEQNPHLRHKSADGAKAQPDQGKGNAGENPTLPSHQFDKKPSAGSHQKRLFSTSARRLEDNKHTADSYFKDVDHSPPSSQKTHQVDSSATGSQVVRPNEPATGGFSRAGPGTKEYQTVTHDGQYDVPPDEGPEKEEKLRYGNIPELDGSQSTDKGVSKPGEGPEGASKGGRKPEGRS
ncbi:hypothetical protein PYCCODRAFT_1480984 [Trametes coccinea BRFM310]|uniref:Uncharacterized protein n=1 Tax=Trametes coccinea (strain BRFM310) TaxID=1353009 RepID=A0A1Y2IA07_TRAC3|nr:hypothetical protein PYCCODRAFT_1480984 [Trametes coccinea BRFM310]